MKAVHLLFFAAALQAQTPSLTNAKFETRAVSGNAVAYLKNLVAGEGGPMWFGYAVPSSQMTSDGCCWEQNCCRLEDSSRGTLSVKPSSPVHLEGSSTELILFRVADHAVQKIRPASLACPLDAGGLRFAWLTGVPPEASIEFVASLIDKPSSKHLDDAAVFAISVHAGEAADRALERLAAPSSPEWLQEKALFWIATARGEHGLRVLEHAAETSPSDGIREKIMFDFSVSREPRAVDDLIRFAHHDSSARVRGQALFWLAQKAGDKAAKEIKNSIENDPDTEVKKKAVFALQNLPKDEGVPMLIEVARNNRNPEVRKQAIFWLGQSGDPRALAFIQQILER